MLRFFNYGVGGFFPDDINETAIGYAIGAGHKDITRMQVECGACLEVVSTDGLCPLSESQPEVLSTRKIYARALLNTWEWGQNEEEGKDEEEPITEKRRDNIVVRSCACTRHSPGMAI